MHYADHKADGSFAWEFKNHMSNASSKNGFIDEGKQNTDQ